MEVSQCPSNANLWFFQSCLCILKFLICPGLVRCSLIHPFTIYGSITLSYLVHMIQTRSVSQISQQFEYAVFRTPTHI